jgi:hypothetical protein
MVRKEEEDPLGKWTLGKGDEHRAGAIGMAARKHPERTSGRLKSCAGSIPAAPFEQATTPRGTCGALTTDCIAERVQAEANVCRFCGHRFEDSESSTGSETPAVAAALHMVARLGSLGKQKPKKLGGGGSAPCHVVKPLAPSQGVRALGEALGGTLKILPIVGAERRSRGVVPEGPLGRVDTQRERIAQW